MMKAHSHIVSFPTLPDWPRAFISEESELAASARIRSCPEDFRVDENLGFSPDGEGEHLLLHIRKRNRNTDQVAKQLARHAGVRARDVGYCGLKDRAAVTTQWFSIWLPGKPDPDWSDMENEDLQILEQARHHRKLQRGALSENRFEIVLRNISANQIDIERRLSLIQQHGVPNYFGEQRFGRDGANLLGAEALFEGKKFQGKSIKDRHLRGLYLSAARSFLFNGVLAARVKAHSWENILPGEAIMLSGSRSFFVCDAVDEEITKRLKEGDIHPSGPLWGRGELPAKGEAGDLEKETLLSYSLFCNGLEQAGMKQERRALRLMINDLRWQWLQDAEQKNNQQKQTPDMQLNFSLQAGSYATTLLREVCNYS